MSLQCFVGEICISHLSHQIINWLLGKHWFPRFCLITIHVEVTHLPVVSVYLLTGLHSGCQRCVDSHCVDIHS